MFTYNKKEEGMKITLLFDGDFDIDVTEIMEEEIIPLLGNYKWVTLDLANVPFVDSSGIGLLINMVNVLKGQEIKVSITNTRQDVEEIFSILQLPEIIGEDVFV